MTNSTKDEKDEKYHLLLWQAVSFCIRQVVLAMSVRYLPRQKAIVMACLSYFAINLFNGYLI